jgi:hypothetical protein
MRPLKLILLLVFLVFSLNGQPHHRDGNWWIELSSSSQTVYMLGVLDGSDLGNRLSYEALLTKKDEGGAPDHQNTV